MIYSLLRGAATVALRWYYADVTIVGDARAVQSGPLLVVMNHPNALVDVLVAGQALPRRMMFTAKATLFSNPVAAALLSWLGVVPLRRASDESADGGRPDPTRNRQTFEAVTRALGRGKAVLIFPEGKSHDEPAMAPLRTGAARMALHGRDSGEVPGLRVLPIGLVFEQKEALRSRILAVIGDPIDVDGFHGTGGAAVNELTAEIDARLRSLTLNYASVEEAMRDARIAESIAALMRHEAPSVGDAGDLRDRTMVARLLPRVRAALTGADQALRARVATFESSLDALADAMARNNVSFDDLAISRSVGGGAIFTAREALVLLLAGPLAFWGWINHLLPFRAAIGAGKRVRQSAADPAMRTILAGAAFVLMMYMAQGALVTLVAGPWWGLAYVLSLPVSADVNLRLRERLDRARRRARTYLAFRARPDLQESLGQQARVLREEVLALAAAFGVAAD